MNVFPRRSFLKTSALAGVGGAAWLSCLPAVAADDVSIDSHYVRFLPEIEPLVRLLEDTSRDRLLEEVATRIKKGTTYREVLTALLLAGVRNIQPRPVGFKFHAVLVVNAAHLASQNSPDEDRWLPIFWALDAFKSSQARDVQEGDWTMSALDEKAVPPPDKAQAAFAKAMDHWDEAAADVAAAGLVRGAGAQEVFDVLCRFGARDFRDIGHKIIFVSNSWRTLQTIGWQHAEPVVRSLAYAMLEHRDGKNPSENDYEVDRPGRNNEKRLKSIRAGWQTGSKDNATIIHLLETYRSSSWDDAAQAVVDVLNRGKSPDCVWDAVKLHAGEMLMRRPGIASLHATTTANALHFAFCQTSHDETRRFLLLQAASFMTMFRGAAGVGNDGVAIDEFKMDTDKEAGVDDLEDVFREVSGDKNRAARKALAFLNQTGDERAFMRMAQRLIYLKGTDAHDYKFSSAILEDFRRLPAALRNRYLAASVFWLKGSGMPDTPLVARTRQALGA